MSTTINLRWGDGYLIVEPIVPDELTKQLRYWHRQMEWQYGKRIATGEHRELYNLEERVDKASGLWLQRLTTMPGFVHRVKGILKSQGMAFQLIDERTPMPQPDMLAAMQGLREYQLECAYVALKSGGGMVACPTGWGKTHIMAAFCRAYSHAELCLRNTPTIVIAAPDKEIVRKNYIDICEIMPDREVGIVMSGQKKVWATDIQLITLDSLHLMDMEDVGVLITDEVHNAASETRAESLAKATKAAKWGMSATPTGRFDGRDLVTEGLFGPVVYTRTYKEGVDDGALVPIRVLWVKLPEPSRGLDRYLSYKQRESRYRHGMYRDPEVVKTISDLMHRIPSEMQTLCIMRHIEQLNELVPSCMDIPYVHGTTSATDLQRQRRDNVSPIAKKERDARYDDVADGTIRKIFSTWVYKQGVNFPEISVIVNAGGGGSDIVARQIPGRESRRVEGKYESYLVDFWHDWDSAKDKKGRTRSGPLLSDDKAREKAYTDLGFDQVWLNSIDEIPFLTAGV
jgi:superfamily II DNA or RNA helicase